MDVIASQEPLTVNLFVLCHGGCVSSLGNK